MNKDKFKELAYKANLRDIDGWNTTNLAISTDKFAELIIKECIDICKDSNGDMDYALDVLTNYLKDGK